MAKSYGDEFGYFWEQEAIKKEKIERDSAAGKGKKTGSAEMSFHKAAPPQHYSLPTEFPSIHEHRRIVIDIETFDPNLKAKGPGTFRKDGFIVGIGVRTDTWAGDYYPLRHKDAPNCDIQQVLKWLRTELFFFRGTVIGANLLYDAEWLATEGVTFPNAKIDDVQYMGPLLDENAFSYKLDKLAERYLNEHKATQEIVALYGTGFITHFDQVHPGHAKTYVMGDLDLPLRLTDVMTPLLVKDDIWNRYDIERRNFHFLLHMRQQGVRFDANAADHLGVRLKQEFKETISKIKHISGIEVDVWAAQSIARAFDKVGIPYPKTAKKNLPSFKKDWLNAHPSDLAGLVAMARRLDKFDGTFIQAWGSEAVNGRIHCLFHPLRSDDTGTVSGRFSSTHPNLQQVPKRDKIFGPLIRALFLPEDNQKWWSWDFSQIEYRFLVHYAVLAKCAGANVAAAMYRNDPNMDFHELAAQLTGKPRATAKNINFGIVYGMGVAHMAEVMGCSLTRAKEILDEYHGKMPFCRELYNLASNRAGQIGFIRTILGGRRHFELWEPAKWQKNADGSMVSKEDRKKALPREAALAEYGSDIKRAYGHKALNSLLQGSAAELNKKAMVDVWEAGLIGPGNPLVAHLTIHDELDGSGDTEGSKEAREAVAEVGQIMMRAMKLEIPVLAAGSTGKNWAEAH